MNRNYIGLIRKDPNSDYGVSFPDFPGVITAGTDLDDARRMAEEALALHVEGLVEDGDPLPAPSTLESVMADRENGGAVAILVPFAAKTQTSMSLTVALPESVLRDIDRYAGRHGMSRSAFVLKASLQALESEAERG